MTDTDKPQGDQEDRWGRMKRQNAKMRLACIAARSWISHAAECERDRLHGGPDICTCDFEGVKAMLDAVISEQPQN